MPETVREVFDMNNHISFQANPETRGTATIQSFEAGGGDPPAGTKATLRPSDRAGSIPSTSPTVPLASETGPGATGAAQASAAVDVLPLRRIDHVRLFVGNARQSAYFYRNAFGFDVIAYAGLETRSRHEAGYVLRQGQI